MTLDPDTKAVLIGDVGQDKVEEVDVLEKGANYQWCYREGDIDGPRPKPAKIFGHDKPPLYAYPHADGNGCVIGGYVYRGKANPDLYGKYVFADNSSGRVWAMSGWRKNEPKLTEMCRSPRNGYSGLPSFGVDADGELYLLQLGRDDGAIFKLGRTGVAGKPLPPTLSQTGAFADTAKLVPSPARPLRRQRPVLVRRGRQDAVGVRPRRRASRLFPPPAASPSPRGRCSSSTSTWPSTNFTPT